MGVPCLGEIPLDPAIRSGGDAGKPVAADDAGSPQAKVFEQLAIRVVEALAPPGIPALPHSESPDYSGRRP
jgi:ATP-binding protein involved in chromosome partitioning